MENIGKLVSLGDGLNAFKLNFEGGLLDDIRDSYESKIRNFISHKNSQKFLEGGKAYSQKVEQSSEDYYLASYGEDPLLWISSNTQATYEIFRRFFDDLGIESQIKTLVDHKNEIRMYCGFFVVGNRAPRNSWHIDYFPGANAYTLITPLFELEKDHGNLLYKNDDSISLYKYEYEEAIIFGDNFSHTTEPYEKSESLRVLVSLTFGTDKIEYWPILGKTIGNQSRYTVLPCGHLLNNCNCMNA